MPFEPIAIVGRACILPGALTPGALWDNVLASRCAITAPSAAQWEAPQTLAQDPREPYAERAWSSAGGYVSGFDPTRLPEQLGVDPVQLTGLDPVFLWVLRGAHDALRDAGFEGATDRAGMILGNLSFPTPAMACYAQSVWLGQQGPSFLGGRARELAGLDSPRAENRFMSGLPAILAARLLGLRGGAFALDAACASSLYAIKLACDRLHDRSADLMLAGAVNAADRVFLHVGFSALAALSRSGQSRPFHRDADGLVPAEGAAFVALKRLSDALVAGDRIHGVIRGVGLSNDGRGRGLLVPSEEGQIRAMQQAYAGSGRSPRDVSLVECHATGTPVGDATEIRSMAAIFKGARDLSIGSIKANLGHPITAAGMAGLLKLTSALEAGILPPTRGADQPIDALAHSPFRVLSQPEPWPGDRPRCAALSAFGFGGNNAHVIVEQWSGRDRGAAVALAAPQRQPNDPIAIVGLCAMVGDDSGLSEFTAQLFSASPTGGRRKSVTVQLEGLRFPPNDLRLTLAQQLLLLEAAREAVENLTLPRERTGLLIGMGTDPEVARYGARWQLSEWAPRWAEALDVPLQADWVEGARDQVQPGLVAAGVVGTMPNILANRINSQLDLAGQSLTVAAEEMSGLTALKLALRALEQRELDAAVVGAVDLSDEPVHRAALAALGGAEAAADATVVLVLKRASDARASGEPVIAVFDGEGAAPQLKLGDAGDSIDLLAARGRSHAASSLLQVAVATLSLRHGVRQAAPGAPLPWFGARTVEVEARSEFQPAQRVRLCSDAPAAPLRSRPAPQVEVFSGENREQVLASLVRGQPSRSGAARLAIVAVPGEQAAQRRHEAQLFLRHGGPAPEGVAYCDAPLDGELAFVFTGAAAAYPGMAGELLIAMPQLAESFWRELADDKAILEAIQRGFSIPEHPLDQLWASALVCQAHAALSRDVLKLSPHAVIGYSSGETNALWATGAWRDRAAMIRELNASPVFQRDLTGDFKALESAWRKQGRSVGEARFRAYAVAAAPDAVRELIADEPCVHLTIVNSPGECVIGGDPSACERVLAKLGRERSWPIAYDLAAHCPEIEEVREAWYALHRRPTHEAPGIRFYWNGAEDPFAPSADGAAEAITQQAVRTLDFPRVIRRAYDDGVRIFLEHGPKNLCSGWISRILGDRPHLAIGYDMAGRGSLGQLMTAVASLVAAGVQLDEAAIIAALQPSLPPKQRRGPLLELPAHPAPISLSAMPGDIQRLPHAPALVATLDSDDQDLATPPEAAGHGPDRSPQPVQLASPSANPMSDKTKPHGSAPRSPSSGPSPAEALGASQILPATWQQTAAGTSPTLVSTLRAAAAHQTQVSALHQAFLTSQAAAQQRFVALQTTMLDGLARRARQQPGQASAGLGHAPQLAATAPGATAEPVPTFQAPSTGVIARPASAARSLPAAPARPVAPSPPLAATRAQPPPPVQAAPAAARSALPAPTPSREPPHQKSRNGRSTLALVPKGPTFTRADLEVHASGRISSIFGPEFADQDQYARQVRMPEPPLLLADRVTGIDAAPGSMGKGTLWTETDVREDSWYLHQGRMPAGIMIESGQADLMLISWLGVDKLNRGERVYRLLGCELTYHGELPRPGDTLVYDIHVDGHAKQGDVRLFFFHYDCRIDGKVVLSVRNGQAGFFTDEELRQSAGVLWDARSAACPSTGALAPPRVTCSRRAFDDAEVRAFAEGRTFACFGKGFELAQAHVSSPRISAGPMQLFHRVTDFDPQGGPWGRGYLRAELSISPDDWFFRGHFKNDPCMPGTLMFEGCLQTMAFYLTALGYTLERDGYRFEPTPELTSTMRCRGQVSPTSKVLVYEVFVAEVAAGPIPELRADLLCTVDGLKAFHAPGVGLRLVPDWPLETWKHGDYGTAARGKGAALNLPSLGGLRGQKEPKAVAENAGFPFDYPSLLACAWGRPSTAFGPFYARFDGPRRVARLPGPPYHFISRVTRTAGEMGALQVGSEVEVEYDIPAAVWYFDDNGTPTMPFCVLMEAALQPCGWLASYVGSTLVTDTDLMFRNLDGSATLTGEIRPGAEVLTSKVRLLNVSRSGGMIIESFEVECLLDSRSVYQMKTVFGFFPKEAFENQAGLPVTEAERLRVEAASDYRRELTTRPAAYFEKAPRLAGGMLCMLDRVTAFDPQGGAHGLGWARAEKDVDPAEWFFKAHFFQDPVQPGSLGIEAFCQLLQFVMLEQGMAQDIAHPRFEPVGLDLPVTWKYRGQIVPTNRKITSELEITEAGRDERGAYARANAYLWVDGKRIYQATGLGMRIVPGAGPSDDRPSGDEEETLNPDVDTWLGDHRPTWTIPALPMMSMIDRLAGAAQRHLGRPIHGMTDVRVLRWLPLPGGAVRLRTDVQDVAGSVEVTLSAWRDAKDPQLSRYEPVAVGRAILEAEPPPQAWPPAEQAQREPDPYETGALFHGPAFQLLQELRMAPHGSSARLDLGADGTPRGTWGQGLLDALTHALPHDAFHRWSDRIPADQVAYPYRVPWLRLYGALPEQGAARVEVRFAGFDGEPRLPMADVQLIVEERVVLALRLVEILLPKGPIGAADAYRRRAFLRDRQYVDGIALSQARGGHTVLDPAVVRQSDWLPGNVANIYRAAPGALLEQVLIKDHVARHRQVHPCQVVVADDLASATTTREPLLCYPVHVIPDGNLLRAEPLAAASLDLTPIKRFWRDYFGIGAWPVEDIHYALIEAFVSNVILEDPDGFSRVKDRSVLYLANHQVGIESLLFSVIVGGLAGRITTTLAKAEHRDSWLGQLIQRCFSYPGVRDPGLITFFKRENQADLAGVLQQLAVDMGAGKSAMVHVQGTRALTCRTPVSVVSSAMLELAAGVNCPIVPVRFARGLPVEPLPQRLEFPVGYGAQEFWIGSPIYPEQLQALPLKARKQRIYDAINGLGPDPAQEIPCPPDPDLEATVRALQQRLGAREEDATLLAVLQRTTPETPLIQRLLQALSSGSLQLGSGPEERWFAPLARQWLGSAGPRVERS